MSTTNYQLPTTNRRGFTLVELLVAISIIAVISTIGLISYSKAQSLGRDAKRKQDLRSIAIALELYYQKNKRYPCTIGWQFSFPSSSTGWLIDKVVSGQPTCRQSGVDEYLNPGYINSIPTDPINNAVNPWDVGNANYSYAYYSGPTYYSCSYGKGYWLITQLENANDPDSALKKPPTPCGGPYGLSPSAFMISQY